MLNSNMHTLFTCSIEINGLLIAFRGKKQEIRLQDLEKREKFNMISQNVIRVVRLPGESSRRGKIDSGL